MTKPIIAGVAAAAAVAAACSPKPPEVSSESVHPRAGARTEINWVGEMTSLFGAKDAPGLEVGKPLPVARMTNLKMKEETLGGPTGRVRLISSLPSLDTPVCEVQTHQLSESAQLAPSVEKITLSADLPYAQRRFAEESKLENVNYLSDYRYSEFGDKTGLRLERNGLLARALIVVDGQGIVRYFQIVPEILKLPNLKRAVEAANALVQAK